MRQFRVCPRCGSMLVPAIAMNESESEFWVHCSRCNTYVNTYVPQEHQAAVHTDPHTYVGNFGG